MGAKATVPTTMQERAPARDHVDTLPPKPSRSSRNQVSTPPHMASAVSTTSSSFLC